MNKVYGAFVDAKKARKGIDEILARGYEKDQLKILSKHVSNDKDKKVWEEIKRTIPLEEYSSEYWEKDSNENEKEMVKKYKANLDKGEILVLFSEDRNTFDEYFKDGVPDWDRREEEFHEDLD